MMRAMKKAGVLSILVAVILLAVAVVAEAQPSDIAGGEELEYRRNCAVCHGIDGRGDGIMRQYLTVPPANLREMAKKQRRQVSILGGYHKIDGLSEVRAHGTPDMPIWGDRFRGRLAVKESLHYHKRQAEFSASLSTWNISRIDFVPPLRRRVTPPAVPSVG